MSPEMKKGGIGGFFLPDSKFGFGFGLKVVSLRKADGSLNSGFWSEAQGVQSYCSAVRFLGGCLKIPLAAQYYLHERDPLYQNVGEDVPVPPIDELFRCEFLDCPKEFQSYKPVNEDLLKRIYCEKLNADLLMVYPVVNGEKDLTCYYGNMSAKDVKDLIVQIFSAILDLYRSGCAHGDIKPENIMVQEGPKGKKIFRLTDFGSVHSDERSVNSVTGTSAFFKKSLCDKILEETKSTLLARVYTDFYALTRTVLAMALGRHPLARGVVNPDCIMEKWPMIRPLWEEIQDVECLTLEKVHRIVTENIRLSKVYDDYMPFHCYSDVGFDVFSEDWMEDIVYGKFHEQITFCKEFDPLMKVHVTFYSQVYNLFPEFYHTPLVEGYDHDREKDWLIFHAPDDVATGKRPQNWENYSPITLENTTLTAEEKNSLIRYGKKLNQYFKKNIDAVAFRPEKKHIFRVNGTLKMLWGKGIALTEPIDYERHFRYLAGE